MLPALTYQPRASLTGMAVPLGRVWLISGVKVRRMTLVCSFPPMIRMSLVYDGGMLDGVGAVVELVDGG